MILSRHIATIAVFGLLAIAAPHSVKALEIGVDPKGNYEPEPYFFGKYVPRFGGAEAEFQPLFNPGIGRVPWEILTSDEKLREIRTLEQLNDDAEVTELLALVDRGGLPGFVGDMALDDVYFRFWLSSQPRRSEILDFMQANNADGTWYLDKSKLRIFLNRGENSGTVDVTSLKKQPYFDENGDLKILYKKRRWVIAVLEGGFREWINPDQGQNIKYKLFATGMQINVLGYYQGESIGNPDVQMELVEVLKNGARNPLYKYYRVTDAACIDIMFTILPDPNEDDFWLISTPSNLTFCASGCEFPGVNATK